MHKPHPGLPLPGGRRAGLRRVKQFIWDDESITQYKLTRNCLDGFDGSSTFSPWLANGNLSVHDFLNIQYFLDYLVVYNYLY